MNWRDFITSAYQARVWQPGVAVKPSFRPGALPKDINAPTSCDLAPLLKGYIKGGC